MRKPHPFVTRVCVTDLAFTPNSAAADDSSPETPNSPSIDYSSADMPNSLDASADASNRISVGGGVSGATASQPKNHSPATGDDDEEDFPQITSPGHMVKQSTRSASDGGGNVCKNRFPTKEEMRSMMIPREQHSCCFVASDAIRWMVEHGFAPTIMNAAAMGQVWPSLLPPCACFAKLMIQSLPRTRHKLV